MKVTLRQIEIFVLLLCGVLTACSGTPVTDEPLPTLAQLPTITPTTNLGNVVPGSPTPITPLNATPPAPTEITPNPIVLPGSLSPTQTSAPVNDLGLDTFPEVLEVGTQITLKGLFSSTDTKSGIAILTNSKGQTVNLLVDEFTAMTANNQVVQISGTVEKQPGNAANAVRVSEIRMFNDATTLATVTDVPIPGVPTAKP